MSQILSSQVLMICEQKKQIHIQKWEQEVNKKKKYDQLDKKKQRNVHPSQQDESGSELTEPLSTISIPSPQGATASSLNVNHPLNLAIDEPINRQETHQFNPKNESTQSGETKGRSFGQTGTPVGDEENHQTASGLSSFTSETLLAPQAPSQEAITINKSSSSLKDLADWTPSEPVCGGFKPTSSSSVSEETSNIMINLTSAANIPQLKISFSYKETDTIKPLLQSRSLEEIKESAGPVDHSVKNRSADPDLHNVSESTMWRRDHGDSSRSLSCPFTHQELPANNINLPRASSLPNMKPQSSFKATSLLKMKPKRGYEEFTPDLIYKEDDVTYMFRCSSPGLYWCRQTGLVFDMKGEGDVSYRIVPWDTRLLSQHGKKPAGPLFDISCQQQSVAQLHLPHCEIRSHCEILSVAHIHDEGIEFIRPERITETHVVINITGYSGFGIIIHGNSHRSFQALVLLFHEVPLESESDHVINVLVLPKNVVFRNVLVFRKELDKEEIFIEMPPHCKLQPKKHYTLSTSPGEDSVQVQPPKAKFDAGSYNNYLTTFRVVYKKTIKEIKLSLRQNNSSSVWESVVCYSAVENKKSFRLIQPDFNSKQQLEVIRRSFIEGISEPVLKSLLDKLLEKRVLNNFEKEYVESEKTKMDKARVLVDIVKKKGDAASSEMISFLCELDPFFSQHLGLI